MAHKRTMPIRIAIHHTLASINGLTAHSIASRLQLNVQSIRGRLVYMVRKGEIRAFPRKGKKGYLYYDICMECGTPLVKSTESRKYTVCPDRECDCHGVE